MISRRYWYQFRTVLLSFAILLVFSLSIFFLFYSDNKTKSNDKIGFTHHDINAELTRYANLRQTYQLTGIVLHWQRLDSVRRIVQTMLDNNDLFHQIIVWNNNPSEHLKHLDLLIPNKTIINRIRIINSKKNLQDQAKYLACQRAQTEACFYVDDNWNIRMYAHSLYAHFLLEPTILHSITDQFTYYTNLMWSFFDNKIDLHTGFSWINCGSIFSRQNSIYHLEYIDKFLNNDIYRELLPQSDQFFALWMNQLPAQFNGHLLHSNDGASSSFENPNFDSLQYQASVLAIQILERILRHLPNRTLFERRRASNRFVTYTKSSSSYTNDLIFYTNCLPIDRLEEIPFDINRDYERSTRKNLPHINNSQHRNYLQHFEKFHTINPVDNDTATCWKMTRSVRRGDLFGIDFQTIQIDGTLTFSIQFAHEKSLQKQLQIAISLDSQRWIVLPREHRAGIVYKKRTRQVKFHTRLFPLGFQSFRFISFESLVDDDRSFHVCEVRVIHR